jgi:hypothetical protein
MHSIPCRNIKIHSKNHIWLQTSCFFILFLNVWMEQQWSIKSPKLFHRIGPWYFIEFLYNAVLHRGRCSLYSFRVTLCPVCKFWQNILLNIVGNVPFMNLNKNIHIQKVYMAMNLKHCMGTTILFVDWRHGAGNLQNNQLTQKLFQIVYLCHMLLQKCWCKAVILSFAYIWENIQAGRYISERQQARH